MRLASHYPLMKSFHSFVLVFLAAVSAGLGAEAYPARIERLDPALDKVLAADAKVEKLADGVTWAEGPVWYEGGIVFSDVPKNVMYRWKDGMENKEVFLQPSGMRAKDTSAFREPGSNGLALDAWSVGTDLGDAEGIFPSTFGISSAGAVLVRPDGFVAWRSPGGSADCRKDIGEALARTLGIESG